MKADLFRYLQSVCRTFLWLQTLWPASRWTGRWRRSRPCCQLWWCVRSYQQPHLWVPSVSRRQSCSVMVRGIRGWASPRHWKKEQKTFFFFSLKRSSHLELAVGGEDANPPVVIVCHDDVTIHVHCDPCGTLQLPWWTTSDPKPHLTLTVIWKHLKKKKRKKRERRFILDTQPLIITPSPGDRPGTDLYALIVAVCHNNPSIAGCWDALDVSKFSFISPTCSCWVNKMSQRLAQHGSHLLAEVVT